MRRFWLGVPTWLCVTIAMVAAAVVLVGTALVRTLTGPLLVVVLTAAAIFAMLAIGTPQLQKWQENQAKRIALTLSPRPSIVSVPAGRSLSEIVTKAAIASREQCMAVEQASMGGASSSHGAGAGGAAKYSEVRELARRREAGESLTQEEAEMLRASEEYIKRSVQPAIASMLSAFSDPETRTREQYLEEVDNYVGEISEYFEKLVDQNYIRGNYGLLKLLVNSDTELPYKDVEVVLRIAGARAIDGDDIDDDLPDFPTKPRTFGVRQSRELLAGYAHFGIDMPVLDIPKLGGMDIRNEEWGTEIRFQVFDLRPGKTHELDDIHLVTRSEPGTILSATWTASAMNMEGRAEGCFAIQVNSDEISKESLTQMPSSLLD